MDNVKDTERVNALRAANSEESPAQQVITHPDDAAVDAFAVAMKEKLAQARAKGRGGWQQCDPTELSIMLREHVEKGDPRDVANFCMFLWSLGKPISDAVLLMGRRAPAQQPFITVRLHNAYGNEYIVPICEKAQAFARISGNRTLTRSVVEEIKSLGYEVRVQQDTRTVL
jgi:hypothetical protein